MQKYSDVVLSAVGTPVAGAVITVTTYPDGAATTIYAADGGPSVASVTTNVNGRFSFYAPNGHYSILVSGTGITPVTYNDVVLFDAADAGASAVKHGTETVASELSALQLADYAALRAYTGARQSVYITGYLGAAAPSGIAGMFVRDDHDTTSTDNGGTVIVASNGKRWKRVYAGAINDQWFGAKCDGVADDTAAINAAINAIVANGGGWLLIHGTPLVSATITIPDTVSVEFAGTPGNFAGRLPTSYLIKKSTMTGPALIVSGQSVALKNGGVVGQTGNTGDNIQITGNTVRWEYPHSSGAGQDGIRVGEDGSAAPNTNAFLLVQPCCASNGRHGIAVMDSIAPGGSPNANSGTIQSPFCSNNGGHGIYGGSSFANTIIAPLCESNTGKGIYLDTKAVNWTIFGGDVEMNSGGAGTSGSDIYIADTEIPCTFQDAGDTVTKVAHGLANTTPIQFSVINSTTGIAINTTYFVVNAAADTFQVSATSGGAPITLTTDGTGIYHAIAVGGGRGLHVFLGTNSGTPPYDGGYQTSRGWAGFAGFGTSSGSGTINGEGTWTPTVAGSTTAGTNSYSVQKGTWFKHGRMVTAIFDVQVSANTVPMAGNLRVSGLPFSNSDSIGGIAVSLMAYTTLPASATAISGAPNGKNFDLYSYGSNIGFQAVTVAAQTANFYSAGRIAGVITYMTPE